jgi:uncharacterized protein YxjI
VNPSGPSALSHQPGLGPLLEESVFTIRQERQFAERLVGIELRNRYQVENASGQALYDVREVQSGVGAFFARQFLGSRRSFTLEIGTVAGEVALTLHRPYTWFLSEMEVRGAQGRTLGRIDQRWRFFSRRLDLLSPTGEVLAFLYGPLFKPWTFQLIQGETEVGKIQKRWSGLLTEAFTNADNFTLQFSHGLDPRLRPLTLAAAFLIDFLYFEQRQRR